MNLASLAWRNLRVRWVRTLATTAGVALAVASLVALVGLARGVESTLLAALEVRGTDIVVTEAGALDVLSSIIPANVADDFEKVHGVDAVAPELARMTSMNNGGSAFVVSWPVGGFPWATLELVAGRLPGQGDREVAVIGKSLAGRHGLSVGDTLELFHAEFRVIGLADSASAFTRNLIFVPLDVAQRLTFREGRATSLNIRLTPDLTQDARDQLIEMMHRDWPDLTIETTETLVQGYTFARIANVLSISISAVALASAILMVFNTMAMSVNERKGEIAIMNAVGWPAGRIVGLILIEGLLIALGAGAAGSLAGAMAAHLIMQIPSISGFVTPQLDAALILISVLVTVAVGIMGSLLPALWATAQLPADILRGR